MNNNTLLFGFLILIFILYIIRIKKNEKFTNIIDYLQDKHIEDIKQKLKD